MKTEPGAALLGGLVAGGAGAAVAMLAARRERPARMEADGVVRALHVSADLMAASVLIDSAMEHYRGSFKNPGMFTPLLSSALTLVAATDGATTISTRGRAFRRDAYGLSTVVGATGVAFHLYNVLKRPGGRRWLNLFYGAPLGAPAALSVCGLLGLAAESIAAQSAPRARLLGAPAGRALAALSALALAGTVAEAALFHFRGAYQNPFMWAPVTLPPVAAGLLVESALASAAARHPFTRLWLIFTLMLGFVGTGFHAYGVSRAMGGWRNWSQNLIDGPPLPAPPSFSALALAGLASLSLIEREARAYERA